MQVLTIHIQTHTHLQSPLKYTCMDLEQMIRFCYEARLLGPQNEGGQEGGGPESSEVGCAVLFNDVFC